jgi:hypothetical protein
MRADFRKIGGHHIEKLRPNQSPGRPPAYLLAVFSIVVSTQFHPKARPMPQIFAICPQDGYSPSFRAGSAKLVYPDGAR